jgi:hypothetical protein
MSISNEKDEFSACLVEYNFIESIVKKYLKNFGEDAWDEIRRKNPNDVGFMIYDMTQCYEFSLSCVDLPFLDPSVIGGMKGIFKQFPQWSCSYAFHYNGVAMGFWFKGDDAIDYLDRAALPEPYASMTYTMARKSRPGDLYHGVDLNKPFF